MCKGQGRSRFRLIQILLNLSRIDGSAADVDEDRLAVDHLRLLLTLPQD